MRNCPPRYVPLISGLLGLAGVICLVVFWPPPSSGALYWVRKRLARNELSDFSSLWYPRCVRTHGGNNMWTETTRRQYRREDLRSASDMTDAEWALIEPHLPAAKRLGRPRRVVLRAVVEALLYLLRTASPWRLLPHDFPNRPTVQRYFYAWQAAGVWETINFLLLQQARERVGREASPSAGVIDSQSAKTTESGGPRRCWRARGCRQEDQGPQTPHHHRYRGPAGGGRVHAADTQDRDGRRTCWPRSAYLTLAAPCLCRWRLCRRQTAALARSTGNGGSRSSSGRIDLPAFPCCRGVGWSSEPSLGLTATAGLPRTSKPRWAAARRGSISLRSNCSRAASLDLQLIASSRKRSTIFAIPSQALTQLAGCSHGSGYGSSRLRSLQQGNKFGAQSTGMLRCGRKQVWLHQVP